MFRSFLFYLFFWVREHFFPILASAIWHRFFNGNLFVHRFARLLRLFVTNGTFFFADLFFMFKFK